MTSNAPHCSTTSPAPSSLTAVILGGGGVGKGTVAARLVELDPSLWLSRSWTTRARRPRERADAYHFVDRERFLAHVAAGGFIEHAEFLGELYGTPVPEPPPGRAVVLEIDVQGAEQVKALQPDAVIILLVPPSREVQAERLRRRGESEPEVQRRLTLTEEEEARGRVIADAVVVNDDLDRAVEEVAGILTSYRRDPGEPV